MHVKQSRNYKTIDLFCFAFDLKNKQSSLLLGIFIHRAFILVAGAVILVTLAISPHPSFPDWDMARNLGQFLDSSTRWGLGANSPLPLSPQIPRAKSGVQNLGTMLWQFNVWPGQSHSHLRVCYFFFFVCYPHVAKLMSGLHGTPSLAHSRYTVAVSFLIFVLFSRTKASQPLSWIGWLKVSFLFHIHPRMPQSHLPLQCWISHGKNTENRYK